MIVDTIGSLISGTINTVSNARDQIRSQNTTQLSVESDGLDDAINQANELNSALVQLDTTRQKGIKGIAQQTATQLKANVASKAGVIQAVALSGATKAVELGSKVAVIGINALKIAAGALISVVATIAIQKFVEYLYETSHQAEITAEKANALKTEIQNLNKELRDQDTFISDNGKRYEELSKGVDNLGRNVSLTTEEYKEYNSLSNEIAEMFPKLINGYTEEGNAILSVKGNIEGLTEAYKENQKTKYQALLNPDEGEEGVDTLLADARNTFVTTEDWFGNKDVSAEDTLAYIDEVVAASKRGNEALEELWMNTVQNSKHAELIDIVFRPIGINSTLDIQELDDNERASVTQQALALAQEYQAELDGAVENVEMVLDVYFYTNPHFDDLDENVRSAMFALFDNIDNDLALELSKSPQTAGAFVNNAVEAIMNDQTAQDALVKLFKLDKNDIPANEAVSLVKQYTKTIANAIGAESDTLLEQFKQRFNLVDIFDFSENFQTSLNKTLSTISPVPGQIKLRYKVEDFYDKNILNQDDIALWESLGEVIPDLTRRMEAFIEAEQQASQSDPFSKQQMITEINSLSEGFESLDKIMASIKDKDNPFDYALLDDEKFTETFSGLGDSYTNFIETVSDSPKDINACQSAFDELLTAWLNSTDIIDGLSDETAQLTIDMLSNMGVANAEEVVMNALAAKHAALAAEKYYNANASESLKNATINEYVEFLNEADCSDITRVALAQLELAKIAVNNTKIDTASDIDQVINLANAAGASAEVLSKLARAKSIYAKAEAQGLNGSAGDLRMLEEADSIMADIESGNFEWDFQLDPNQFKSATYSGGTKTNKGGGSDKKEQEKQFDWIETRLERLKAQREELNELGSSSIVDFFGISQEDLDRAKELFSMSLSPGSQEVNELVDIANRAKMSIGELQQLVQSGASANNRESYLQQVLNKDRELIETNKLAIAAYKAEYDSVKGLVSPEIQAKIESGDINIEEYSGDEAENIEKVQDAYEKYSDSISNQRDLENQLYEDTRSYYENRINYINAQNTAIENSNNLIQAQMDYMQEAGEIVTASSYEQLIDNLDRQISLMEKRKAEQEAELQALINSEDFDMGEDSEAYYELQDSIADTEAEIIDLETVQEEYNNTLLQMPIDNMDILLNMYQSITTEIENWGATLEASGKKLDQNYYQTLINNGMEIIDQYEEQADLIEDIMDEYDEGSDQWNELYDRLQNVNSEISSMVQNLYEWNEALLQLPLDSINDYADNLQQIADAMSEVMSEYNTVIDAVVGAIDAEIDAINEEKDAINDAYQDRIDALQDQLDLLDEQNEKKQLQLDLEQAQYNLEQLRNQKTVRTIRDGRIQYEIDQEALKDAQDAVDDAEYNIMRDELEGQIEDLQDELDDINERYDDQIERLEEIANKWEEIRTNVEQYNKELIASDYLGEGWQDKVISGNDQDIYEMFKNMYESLNNQQNAYNEQIENTQNISELLNSYIEAYKEGTITYQEAMTGMKDVLSQINEHTTALDNLQNILDFSGVSNDTANNAESILGAIQDSLTETANELLKSFETYNENSGLITEYTSSWEQLTNNVDDIKDTLEDVRDNLEDALEEARDRDEEEDDDDDDRGNRGATGLHSYKGPLSYNKGIANGLVGSGSESSREDKMKLLGLRPLNEDEVIRILHKGEAVFNPDQQNQLLRNFETAYNAAIPKVAMPNIPNITPANTSNNVEISMGDVILPNVQDVDGFAKAIGTRFGAVLRQEVGRNIK